MMRLGKCPKCGTWTWLVKHHIYPQSQYPDETETIKICSNCHVDIHQKLGKLDKDKKVYYSFHMSWLWGILLILIILGLTQII